jgi:chromosomal replication initiator protein
MAEWDYEIFWKEMINQVKNELEEKEFTMWFNLEYLSAMENELTVAVPSSFFRDQVKQRYQKYIETKLKDLTGKDIAILFEVKPRNEQKTQTPAKEKPAPAAVKAEGKKKNHLQLRQDYTFDTYVVGENNNFAFNAASAVARNPGVPNYNPLLIYGGAGLGKTHLMQAIGNYIHHDSDNKVLYITAETFTNELVDAFKERNTATFKKKYRYVDILLIDDIHFLQKKEAIQEELFYTFNALYDTNKQMIFTCDRPVSELKSFNDRLQSRVGRGLSVDLQPPNYETRCAILKKKIDIHNQGPVKSKYIQIPDEVIDLISRNVSSNTRDLEAALNRIIAYAELVGESITLGVAQQQLKDVFASPKQANMSIETIQRVTAEYFNLSINDLKGKKRTQSVVFPRQLAMYIVREITEYTTTEIGQAFGDRDHSTVMHACQKIEERIRSDPAMDTTIENLKRKIKEYSAKS